MEKIKSKIERIKEKYKKTEEKRLVLDDISEAKNELECAIRNFNEITDDEYLDIAIMSINLAKKKYEIRLKEAKSFFQTEKAV